ncbi:MAG: type transport system ATP-binding protein [Clostridiales bacterium]|nr:type transport system ATP-binding protein [Clostridiales bacterium]
MSDIVKVEGLSKSYQGRRVVDSLSFCVKKGHVLGLLGANGAGKSTSMECILGTKKRDKGQVSIYGMDPLFERKRVFERVGVQFQDSCYQREIRVEELCEETKGLYSKTMDYRQLLKRFGILEKSKNQVKDLSGGERQRLFIVLALIAKPELVFLDELTTGLDASARREVWRILLGLKEAGITMLLTSHFMDEVEILCDEILILKKGITVYHGSVQEAINNSPYEKLEDAYLWYAHEKEEEGFE